MTQVLPCPKCGSTEIYWVSRNRTPAPDELLGIRCINCMYTVNSGISNELTARMWGFADDPLAEMLERPAGPDTDEQNKEYAMRLLIGLLILSFAIGLAFGIALRP